MNAALFPRRLVAFALAAGAIFYAFCGQSQTNAVRINFADFSMAQRPVTRITITAQSWVADSSQFWLNTPKNASVATDPSITNGTLVVTQKLGVPYQISFYGYSTWTTNYLIPTNATVSGDGTILAAQWIGKYTDQANFTWSSPVVSNLNYSILVTNTPGVTNLASGSANHISGGTLTLGTNISQFYNDVGYGTGTGTNGGSPLAAGTNTVVRTLGGTNFVDVPQSKFDAKLDTNAVTSGATPFNLQSASGYPYSNLVNPPDVVTNNSSGNNLSGTFNGNFTGPGYNMVNTAQGVVIANAFTNAAGSFSADGAGNVKANTLAGNGAGITGLTNGANLTGIPPTAIVGGVGTLGALTNGSPLNATNLYGSIPSSNVSGAYYTAQGTNMLIVPTTNNGVVTLTFNATGSATLPPGVVTNVANFVPQGNADITVALQSALSKGGHVLMAAGDYYVTNTLHTTNNTWLTAYGATIHVPTTMTNFVLYKNTNENNVVIEGLTLDGGYLGTPFNQQGTGVTNVGGGNYFPDVAAFSPFVNHSGFYIAMAGSGRMIDTEAYGFTGYGYFLQNSNGSGSMKAQMVEFIGANVAHDNYIGFEPQQWEYNMGDGLIGSISGVSATNRVAEYWKANSIRAFNNTIGVALCAGNHNMTGAEVTANYIGIWLGTGHNATHGIIEGNTLNHNVWGIFGNGWQGGELICGNVFLGSSSGPNGEHGDIYLYDVGKCEVINNRFVSGPVTFTLTSPGNLNIFHDNSYVGMWGTDFVFNTVSPGTNWVWGNYSETVPGNTDGQPLPFPVAGNGSGLTNYSPANLATDGTQIPVGSLFNGTSNGPGYMLYLGSDNVRRQTYNGASLTNLNLTGSTGAVTLPQLPSAVVTNGTSYTNLSGPDIGTASWFIRAYSTAQWNGNDFPIGPLNGQYLGWDSSSVHFKWFNFSPTNLIAGAIPGGVTVPATNVTGILPMGTLTTDGASNGWVYYIGNDGLRHLTNSLSVTNDATKLNGMVPSSSLTTGSFANAYTNTSTTVTIGNWQFASSALKNIATGTSVFLNYGGTWDGGANGEMVIQNGSDLKITMPLKLPTNAAPSNVTIGVTAPDFWVKATNSNTGAVMFTPYWTNH